MSKQVESNRKYYLKMISRTMWEVLGQFLPFMYFPFYFIRSNNCQRRKKNI